MSEPSKDDKLRQELSEQLDKLFEMQVRRIEIDMKTEREIRKLFPTVTQDFKVARDLLVAKAMLHGLIDSDTTKQRLVRSVTEALQNISTPTATAVLGTKSAGADT